MIQSEVSLQEALNRVNRNPDPHQGLWSSMPLPDGGELELFPLSTTFLLMIYLPKRTNGIFWWGYFLLSCESLSEEYMFFC